MPSACRLLGIPFSPSRPWIISASTPSSASATGTSSSLSPSTAPTVDDATREGARKSVTRRYIGGLEHDAARLRRRHRSSPARGGALRRRDERALVGREGTQRRLRGG